ncbi:MAG: putative manganese-dependent inorganic diphosphatase [Oscillospiraceae bacterium]|nr:putative manganese-dependent inorganic diphosphatase [Oscillospiraceae bacterium]
MTKSAHKVVVIGHKTPDTDSICSAIAYAELKNRTSDLVCEARRAGELSQETAYVLHRFGVEAPRLCLDVNPKVRDVDYREIDGIPGDTSMRRAWLMMRDQEIDTLPVVDEENNLLGLISVKDIANDNMDVFDTKLLAKSRTSYRNILETLKGTMCVGDPDGYVERGQVFIGAASPEVLEETLSPGDIVILSNRYESQMCAIEMESSLLIVCNGTTVPKTIQRRAAEKHVAIICVPYDTYATAKLISQCAPISYIMTTEKLLKFSLYTTVDDVLKVMGKVRHRYFPIVDENGKYCGMVSRRNVIGMKKRQMILVDHNERTQAVEGYDKAEILEIIDHHRIGNLETAGPVYFRNQPVGCTATIVTQMYREAGEEIPPRIAGLLLAAILSDTLVFRSPTCTPVDERTARELAVIAGVDIEEFAAEMFDAGERLNDRSAEQVMTQDYKTFLCGEIRFGIAQNSYLTEENLKAACELVKPAMEAFRRKQELDDFYVLLTDIKGQLSYALYCGDNAKSLLLDNFEHTEGEKGVTLLPGVISRKKQVVPTLMAAYQQL